jgi:hypothetical protein
MYVLYYASMLRCLHLVRILVSTDHPYLGVGRHTFIAVGTSDPLAPPLAPWPLQLLSVPLQALS